MIAASGALRLFAEDAGDSLGRGYDGWRQDTALAGAKRTQPERTLASSSLSTREAVDMGTDEATPCDRLVTGLILLALFSPALPARAQDDFVAQAKAAKAKGDVDTAITILEEGLAGDPGNVSGHYVLGWLYVQKAQQERAIASFRKVAELSPDTDEGREAKAALKRLGAAGGTEGAAVSPTASAAPNTVAAPVLLGPRPGNRPAHVTVDPQRMCPLVDGEPFFAIGACSIPAEHMQMAAEAGLNLTCRWGGPGGEWGRRLKRALAEGEGAGRAYIRQYLGAAQEAGLWAIEFPAQFGYEDLSWSIPLEAFQWSFRRFIADPLPFVVASVKDHPALFGYLGLDEPGPAHQDLCREFTEAVHARDPSHPVWFNFCVGLPEWPEAYDVPSLDWYPRTDQTPLIHAYEVVLRNSQLAHKHQRPYWHMALMEAGWVCYAPLGPEAQRAQTYMALIGGANGIVWWVWPARHVDTWNVIQQLAAEMRALTPVLTEPPASTNVRWEPPQLRNTVQVRAIRHADRTWLLTANACQTPAEVHFVLPTAPSGPVRVSFEDREINTTGRQLADRLEGYGRHVYEVDAQWPEAAEIMLEVELEEAEVAPTEVHERQALSRNLIYDPGFESDLYWTFEGGTDSAEQALGRFDENSRHGGRRSAAVERLGAESRSMWVGRYLELKANGRYTFGGYARAETLGPALIRMYLEGEPGCDFIQTATWVQVDDFAPWRQYSTVFATRDRSVRVRPVCDFLHFSGSCPNAGADGRAWFDDPFLIEAPPGVRNMVVNGGFEGPESLRGWPRWWGFGGDLTPPAHVGTPTSQWGLDRTQPYEGQKSLRLVTPATRQWGMVDVDPRPTGVGAVLGAGTRLAKGRTYVLSAYMRADPPGTMVEVRNGDPEHNSLQRVSGEWERYAFPVTPDRDIDLVSVGFEVLEAGTLWVDAVQYEEGAEPTVYREWRE